MNPRIQKYVILYPTQKHVKRNWSHDSFGNSIL